MVGNDQPTLYLVDDDPETQEEVRRLAGTMQLRCETFGSGQEFLDACEGIQVGCVVLEVRLPGIGGLQVQKAFQPYRHTH